MADKQSKTSASIYLRKNGSFGASCDGVSDTGHTIWEDSGKFTVFSLDDSDYKIAENVSRRKAEIAIEHDWRSASNVGRQS